MVMWSEPVMRTPARGFSAAYLRRMDIRPGISCSAIEISLRPQSARERSATLKAGAAAVRSIVAGVIFPLNLISIYQNVLIQYWERAMASIVKSLRVLGDTNRL